VASSGRLFPPWGGSARSGSSDAVVIPGSVLALLPVNVCPFGVYVCMAFDTHTLEVRRIKPVGACWVVHDWDDVVNIHSCPSASAPFADWVPAEQGTT